MNVTIPLYVEEQRRPGAAAPRYVVRPLFFREPVRSDELLGRATAKLAGDLRKLLDGLGKRLRHDDLAEWCFAPPLQEHRPALRLELRRTTLQCRPTVVTFPALGRTIALVPALDELWFEVDEPRRLEARTAEVLSAHLRRLEKEGGEDAPAAPEGLSARAWLGGVELDVSTAQAKPAQPPPFLALGGPPVASGREELEKVGRCLDWLYPDELDRVILRDRDVDELTRLLTGNDRRPVVLAGPRMVGKTALVHEYVHRRVARRKSPYVHQHNVWLLGPQRLISGMAYVGQWEQRLLAILDEAKRRDHVLYFDDLLGLYAAGLTRDSDLSVAHVLRPYVERRDVRVLAEMTPEALRVLRERDRGLADLLHVLPVRELTAVENRRVLVESMRRFEGAHRCRFDLDALPAATDLLDRYVRGAVMPGKAADLLRRLAAKHRGRDVGRQTVLDEFHATSGLSVRFLDDRLRLRRQDVIDAISGELVGQDAAVRAMADVVAVAKARLNDPGRPLGSLLFLGPTGVGKTQAAKALAAYLFGDAERLVRFDLNEFVDPLSAERLVGSFARPEGLLTAAVRRQPFGVILLDEIEKSHPDVLDLLLQVLGDGRLTDALGRTTDFTNTVIVFTSNLGSREAMADFGLRPAARPGGGGDDDGSAAGGADDRRREGAFVAAAERFFRPEFFNRLDRVVPFRPLTRREVRRIATRLIGDVLNRDGLLQRKCLLRIEPAAMEKIVDQGFHPELGARALKRAVERQLTRPVAARLAVMKSGTPTVVSVLPGQDGVVVQTLPLEGAPPAADAARVSSAAARDPGDTLERLSDATDRVGRGLESSQPERVLSQDRLGVRHYRYFAIREQEQRARRRLRRAFDRLDAPPAARRTGTFPSRVSPRAPRPVELRRWSATDSDAHALWREFAAAEQVNTYLSELTQASEPLGRDGIEELVQQAVQEVAILRAMAGGDPGEEGDRVLVHLRSLADAEAGQRLALRAAYEQLFDRQIGFAATALKWPFAPDPAVGDAYGPRSELLLLEMPGVATLMRGEVGTHLFLLADGGILPVQVMLLPLRLGDDAVAAPVADHAGRRTRWQADLAAGSARPEDDPWPLGPVVRIYGHGHGGGTLDLRSGLVSPEPAPSAAQLRAFILSGLAPPVEPADASRSEQQGQ